MESLSLTQLFGEATQTENTLVIDKSSLFLLTPLPHNTPESLLAAILLTSLQNFQGVITDENYQPITDENYQPITFDNSDAFELMKIFQWKPYIAEKLSQYLVINSIIIQSFTLYAD